MKRLAVLASAAALAACASEPRAPHDPSHASKRQWQRIVLDREGAEVWGQYRRHTEPYETDPALDWVDLRVEFAAPQLFELWQLHYRSRSESWVVDCANGTGLRMGTAYFAEPDLQSWLANSDAFGRYSDYKPSPEVTAICAFLRSSDNRDALPAKARSHAYSSS